MATPLATGPCLIYALLPQNLSVLFPVGGRPNVNVLRPGALPGALRLGAVLNNNGPGGLAGGRIENEKPEFDTVLLLMRRLVPVFLGTCEDYPDVSFDPAYTPIYRNVSGNVHPWERIYEGEEATIVADLNYYNEVIYGFLAAKAAGGVLNLPTVQRGVDGPNYIGTLMSTEGGCVPLVLLFPWAQKPANRRLLPAGYRFFATVLQNDRLGPLSCRPRKVRIVFRAMRVITRGGACYLYDHDVRGMPFPA